MNKWSLGMQICKSLSASMGPPKVKRNGRHESENHEEGSSQNGPSKETWQLEEK